jgi:protein-S-isoprenylcysteine O-methyltransferase Ste14
MTTLFDLYKTAISNYIDKFGIILFISNFFVAFGIIVIYLRVHKNFTDAKAQKNNQVKEIRSIVETVSMSAFFLICTIIVLFNIGMFETSFNFYSVKIVAIILYLFGTFINIYGRQCLGKNWGNNVVIYKDHNLVTSGIYKYIRHPLYSSIMLMLYSVSIIYQNYLVALLTTIIFIPFMYYRAKQEEIELIKQFGDKYINYCMNVGMFIPKFLKRK